jgi:hypothetical protein
MKDTFKLFRIIALFAVIGFSMVVCDNGTTNDLGMETLNFSGKLYTRVPPSDVFNDYTGSEVALVGRKIGGSGTIKNGQLTFTIGTPAILNPMGDVFGGYDNLIFTPSDTQGRYLIINTSSGSHFIVKQDMKNWDQEVDYLYVDRDVKITGTGQALERGRTSDINVSLKKGWNAIYTSRSGKFGNYIFTEKPGDNKSCKWVMYPNN